MKPLQLIGLTVCLALFAGCECTKTTTSVEQQDSKRVAVVQHQQTYAEDVDEAHRNLWNAQHDILTRDGNAASHYY
jgi:hypothetical protein